MRLNIPRDLYTWDALGVAALALITAGIGMMHIPSALIFVGVVAGAAYAMRELNEARGGK